MSIQRDPLNWPNALRAVIWIVVVVATINDRFDVAATLIGLHLIAESALQFLNPRIPYGWEGGEPSGYIVGTPARIIALLFGLVGLAILVLGGDFLEALFRPRG